MITSSSRHDSDDAIDILLVEDNPGDIRLTEEAFKEAETKIKLRAITNGDDAIDFLKKQATDESRSLPDIVLLDLNLPGKDGCEVLKTIRDDSRLKLLPVIMLTSLEAHDDIKRCYKAHTNAYLTKPSNPEEFNSIVRTVEKFWFDRAQIPPLAQ